MAAAAADNSQLDPVSLVRLKAEDPTGTRAATEADKVRLCAAAIARYQYEKRTAVNQRPEFAEPEEPAFQYLQIQTRLDRLERIEPWPGASLEDLKLMCGMLDYALEHVHVRESAWSEAVAKAGAKYSDGRKEELDDLDYAREDPANGTDFKRVTRMPYIFRYGTSSEEDRIVRLRPILDRAALTIHFEPEAEVRERLEAERLLVNRWAVSRRTEAVEDFFDTRDGRIINLDDCFELEEGAAKIRRDIEEMEDGQKDGINEAEKRATTSMPLLNQRAGTDIGDLQRDGAYAEYSPDPPSRSSELDGDLYSLIWRHSGGCTAAGRRVDRVPEEA